jgi:hypothetical protein
MNLRRVLQASLFTLLASSLLPRVAHAAVSDDAVDAPAAPPPPATHWKADPLFPGARHGSIGVATGVPFVGMGEVAYAPTEHFAIGAIVGVTPFVLGVGLRPRVALPLGRTYRVALASPVLYYPTGEGLIGNGAPWFLAQPGLRLERQLGEHAYVHAGAGVVAAIGFPAKNERGEMVSTYNDKHVVDKGTPWGVWNTVLLGGAVSVFDRTTVFAEGMLIMRGVRLAGDEWIGGPPVAFTLGVARVL